MGPGAAPLPASNSPCVLRILVSPFSTGFLLADDNCPKCCGIPAPIAKDECIIRGFSQPCGMPDAFDVDGPANNFQLYTLYSGTGSATGAPPLQLDFTIDLRALDDTVVIVTARAYYAFSGVFGPGDTSAVVDNGGSHTGTTTVTAQWNAAGLAHLRAYQGKICPIRATGSWSTPPSSRTFSFTQIEIGTAPVGD